MLFLNFSVDFKGMWTSDVDIVSLKPPVTHQSPRGPEAAAAYSLDFVNVLVPLFQMPLPIKNVSRFFSFMVYLLTNQSVTLVYNSRLFCASPTNSNHQSILAVNWKIHYFF